MRLRYTQFNRRNRRRNLKGIMTPDALQRACADVQSGHVARAIGRLQTLAGARPFDPAVLQPLAYAYVSIGRFAEAEPVLRRLVALVPQSVQVVDLMGFCLISLKRYGEAAGWYERVLIQFPASAVCCCNYGIALTELGLYANASAQFRRAQTLDPQMAAAFYNGGNASFSLGRMDEAEEQYMRTLTIAPQFAAAYAGIGGVRQAQGRFAEARAAFARAVALAPKSTGFHLALARSARFVEGDSRLLELKKLAVTAGRLGELERAYLHFALGKAYDDLHRPALAMAEWQAANAAKRRAIEYDEAARLRSLERIAEIFSAEFLAAHRGASADETPIFIVGMPRSGTTLVEQILASHPAVLGGGELTALEDLAREGAADGMLPPAARMSSDWLTDFGRRYASALAACVPAGENFKRITDKMPDNFRFVGLIHLALPGAKIVHVRRSPADTCLSCYSILFQRRQEYTYDLGELGRYYRAYDRLMAHWRAVLPADAWLEIRYEDFVANFEVTARRLIAFCGLDWNERCTRFHQTERLVCSASLQQVREPLYGHSVGRWQAYAAGLAPLFAALGPELSPQDNRP